MTIKAGQRKRRKARVAMMSEIPSDVAGRWELIVSSAAQQLFTSRKNLLDSVGRRPYKGLPVGGIELQGRWGQIRHDREALIEVFQANAKFKEDGRVLLPKSMVASMMKQEKSFKESGVD
jgi:hypothetical protein